MLRNRKQQLPGPPAEPVLSPESAITVVSGLPRSGTSLMMQMLSAGGSIVLTDDHRAPNEDNPRGYFEFEPVKNLIQDVSWLPLARGKCVKIISQLLVELPATETYRIVIMQRDVNEVLASQEAMIARRGGRAYSSAALSDAFIVHLNKLKLWLAEQDNISTLYVDYASTIAAPLAAAEQVNKFLGGHLNGLAMAAQVDPMLYRHRW
jgi:hypothetical protein